MSAPKLAARQRGRLPQPGAYPGAYMDELAASGLAITTQPEICAIIGQLERGRQAAVVTDPPHIMRAFNRHTGIWNRAD